MCPWVQCIVCAGDHVHPPCICSKQMSCKIMGPQMFYKSRTHLQVLGARKVAWRTFNTEDPQFWNYLRTSALSGTMYPYPMICVIHSVPVHSPKHNFHQSPMWSQIINQSATTCLQKCLSQPSTGSNHSHWALTASHRILLVTPWKRKALPPYAASSCVHSSQHGSWPVGKAFSWW